MNESQETSLLQSAQHLVADALTQVGETLLCPQGINRVIGCLAIVSATSDVIDKRFIRGALTAGAGMLYLK